MLAAPHRGAALSRGGKVSFPSPHLALVLRAHMPGALPGRMAREFQHLSPIRCHWL